MKKTIDELYPCHNGKANPPPIYKSPRFRLGQFGGNFRQKGYMIGLVCRFRYGAESIRVLPFSIIGHCPEIVIDFVEFIPRKGFGAKET